MNKNNSGIERELYRFLRNNSCSISFFKFIHQTFNSDHYLKYDNSKTLHINLRRRHPYDYYSPKNMIWSVVKPWSYSHKLDVSLFLEDLSDKWAKYYTKKKLCSKYCTRQGSLIEEKL